MKLVKFEDGSYGVRCHWFFGWYFKDLVTDGYVWKKNEPWFHHCKGSIETAKRAYYKSNTNKPSTKHEVVE